MKKFLQIQSKKAINPLVLLLVLALTFSCNAPSDEREPTNGEEEGGYEKYFEATRYAAMGDNWASITQAHFKRALTFVF